METLKVKKPVVHFHILNRTCSVNDNLKLRKKIRDSKKRSLDKKADF